MSDTEPTAARLSEAEIFRAADVAEDAVIRDIQMAEWRADVADGLTVLGFKQWEDDHE
jgi:hypothetical protein